MGLPDMTSSGPQRHMLVYPLETGALHTGHVALSSK